MSNTFKNFRDFSQRVLTRLAFTPDQNHFFYQMRSFSGKYTEFAELLESNPDKKIQFLEALNEQMKSKLKGEITSVSAGLSMFGYLPARNFLVATTITNEIRNMSPTSPEIRKILSFSLKTEQINADLAPHYFLGGLLFDISRVAISRFIQENPNDKDIFPPLWEKLLEEIWKHSAQVCQLATKLATQLIPNDKGILKDICIDSFAHDIGKLFLFFFSPLEKVETLIKTINLADKNWIEEKHNLPFSHDLLGYLIVGQITCLQDVSWTVLNHHQPFLAQRHGKASHTRTTLVWLADHLLRYKDFHKTTKMPEPLVENWFHTHHLALSGCTLEIFKRSLEALSQTK